MKKLFSLILVIALCVLTLAGCYRNDYAIMLGVHTSQSGASVTHTIAAIVIDKDYEIVSCRIDAIEVKAKFTNEGKIDDKPTYQSKAEKGDEYGMLNSPWGGGSTLAEWYEQAEAFEAYVVGKTRNEVKDIAVENGKATDVELTAGCTIAVTDFMAAIDKAFASNYMVGLQTKEEISLGVAVTADVTEKTGAVASYTADFSAVAMVGGKIQAALIDSKEVTAKITDGQFGKIEDKGTKNEQGDNYGMVAYGGAKYEWYEQAQALADAAIGKDASEVAAIDVDLVAGCTVYAGGYKSVLEKAAKNVR